MNIRHSILKWLTRGVGPSSPAPNWLGGMTGGLPGPKNVAQALDANRGYAYACVDVIASRTASVDSLLYTKRMKGGQVQLDPLDQHIFYDLLENGNTFFDRWRLMYLLSAHRNLAGTGYWYLDVNGAGRPTTIWPLEPNRVEKEVKTGGITYKYSRADNTALILPSDQVLEFPKPNVKDLYAGWSPLQAGSLPYDIGQYIDDYQHQLFKDGGWYMYALKTKQDPSKEDKDRMRTEWMGRFKPSGRFTPPILGQDLDIVQGPSNLDLDLGGLDDRVRDKILAMYRVPKSKLGFSESANKASMFAADVAFNQEVIQPELRQIADVINKKLIPLYGRQGLPKVFVFSNPVPTDREELRADVDLGLKHGSITDNEAREKLGLPPTDNGDVRYKQFNLVEVGAPPTTQGERGVTPLKRDSTQLKFTKAFWTPERREHYWYQVKASLEQEEKRWEPVLKKLWDAQEKWLLDAIAKLTLPDKYAGWSRKKVEADIIKQDIPTIDPDDWAELSTELALPVIRQIVQGAGEDAVALVGVGVSFDMSDPRVVEYIELRGAQFTNINAATSETMRKTLGEGIMNGETTDQLAKRISDKFTEMTGTDLKPGRAKTIASTETHIAQEGARLEGFLQSGVEYKQWISARTGEARLNHIEAEEKYAAEPELLTEPFEIDGINGGIVLMMVPGQSGDPAEDINCKCTHVPYQEA